MYGETNLKIEGERWRAMAGILSDWWAAKRKSGASPNLIFDRASWLGRGEEERRLDEWRIRSGAEGP